MKMTRTAVLFGSMLAAALLALNCNGDEGGDDTAETAEPSAASDAADVTPEQVQAWLKSAGKDLELENIATETSLSLHHEALTDDSLVNLTAMPALKDLYLGSASFSDEALLNLMPLRDRLETLSIDDPKEITDAGLAHLAGFTKLKSLRITKSKLEGPGLVHLANMKALEKLELYNNNIPDEHLAVLEELTALEYLDLRWNAALTDGFIEHIKNLPALRSVLLTKTNVTGSGFKHLPASLKTLSASYCKKIVDDNLEGLATREGITALYLDGASVKDAGLKHFAGMKNLKELNLRYAELDGSGLGDLENLPSLETLHLYDTKVSAKSLAALEGLPALEKLFVSGEQIDDSVFKSVAKLKALKDLSLYSTGITDKGIKQVSKLKGLTSLDVSYTGLTDKSAAGFGKLKKLEKLNLSKTKITDKGVEKIRKALPKCEIRQ